MPAKKLQHHRSVLSMPQAVIRLRSESEMILGELLRNFRRVAILDFFGGSCPGEALTSVGTMHLLARLGKNVVCIQSAATYSPDAVRRSHPDCVLIQGGGQSSDLTRRMKHRTQIVTDLRRTPVIQLPQSFIAADEVLQACADDLRSHPDFTALVSDRLSYEQLKNAGIRSIRICPDVAFSSPVQQAPALAASPQVLFLRSFPPDRSFLSDSDAAAGAGVVIDDWNDEQEAEGSSLPFPSSVRSTIDRYLLQVKARRRVLQAMRKIEPYRQIITDHLYAAVLSCLMGKETILLEQPGQSMQQVPGEGLIRSFSKAGSVDEALRRLAPVSLRPAGPEKILIAVYSCQKHRKTRLEMIRRSWAAKLPAHVVIRYFIGGHVLEDSDQLRPDEVLLPCPDSYDELPKKTHAMLQYAVANHQFDHIVKIDDDTQVMDLHELLYQAAQGDYVGALKGHVSNPLHHLRRENSANPNPVPADLLQWEFMEGPVYALSRRCAEYIAGLPASEIRELQEPVAYEDRMIGRLVTLSEQPFHVYNVPGIVRRCFEPATSRKNALSLYGTRTLARTDYTVALQRFVAVLQKFIPGRMFEFVWNPGVTVIGWILRRWG